MGNNQNDKDLIMAAFFALLGDTTAMVFVKDMDLKYVVASMPFVAMTGKTTVDEVVGHTDIEIFGNRHLARRYMEDDRRLIKSGQNLINYIEPITDKNGQSRYGTTSKYILKNPDGEAIGILGITRDITRDYIARQNYENELKYLFELPEDTYAVCYIDVDNWRIISQKKRDIDTATIQGGHTVEKIYEDAYESIIDKDSDVAKFYKNFSADNIRQIYESGRRNLGYEYQRTMSDGSEKWVYNDIKFLTNINDDHLCVMLSLKDIDKAKRKEKEIAIAAKMDKMTMVYNRETTMQAIKKVLENNNELNHALFMIDVDNFKKLNDTLGHKAGDDFLIKIASVIKNKFRHNDVVGRVGGDEFFALMNDVKDQTIIRKKADSLLKDVTDLCEDYKDINLSISIGISIFPLNGDSLDELYQSADDAMYNSKKKGKNCYTIAEYNADK